MTQYEQFFSRAGQTMRESAIRKMGAVLAQARDMISFAPGYPAEDTFAWEAFADIARELLTGDDGSVLQYGPTRGYKPLRDFIAGLMQERHIAAVASSVVVTTGSQQGLDLLARVLFDPDDVVLVELPSYTGAITAFRSVGASLVGVRQSADGVDLDELDETIVRLRGEGRRVKALYVVPNFQNPTGLLLGAAKRPHLAEWAERRNVLVIEDDPYRDLYFPDVASEGETRPISADDTNGRVIYLSSFSKTLAPGFRVAWLHAPEPLAAKLEIAKQAEDLCSGGLDQRVVYEACRRGILAKNLPKLRLHYQNKRDVMVKALHQHLAGKVTWPEPRGGFFLWAKLAGSLQTDALLARARERGVIFVAGSAFFVDGSGAQHLRLSFSAPPPDRIEEGVARLAAAVSDASAEAGEAATHAGSR
jgi:2-aminoadipate transaminase